MIFKPPVATSRLCSHFTCTDRAAWRHIPKDAARDSFGGFPLCDRHKCDDCIRLAAPSQ